MSDTLTNEPGTNDTPESWEFPGWGRASRITNLGSAPIRIFRLDQPTKNELDVWRSTAICGNDISSSVLYVSALCAAQAGVLAPVVLLIVGVVLYLYRKVYAEAGSALPLNGGTYTLLLNTTSKRLAAGAACLTLLSYIATAVISASDAMDYLHGVFPHFDIIYATIVLLGLFALLNVLGITESANVALAIFVVHIATLTILSLVSGFHVLQDTTLFKANWA
ncbi:MAG TPA: amino acid permease, partial [Pseudomonadales bacterium]|nr:amino acid permease [Pseudomonadales bacterium]